jgi:hypothetical protein
VLDLVKSCAALAWMCDRRVPPIPGCDCLRAEQRCATQLRGIYPWHRAVRRRADGAGEPGTRVEQLEVVFGLFVVLVVIATLARRIDVPYPILLVLGGLAIGLLPGLPRVELNPDLVLLVFLPPLLYAAAIATPVRELRDNLQPISLLAFGLVLATIAVVAVVAHLAIPG